MKMSNFALTFAGFFLVASGCSLVNAPDELSAGNDGSGSTGAGDGDGDGDGDGSGDDATVEVGMEVEFKAESGKQLKGKVIKILEDAESVKVKTPKGNIHTVKLDDITLPEKEADDDEGGEDEGAGKTAKVKKHKK